MFSWIESCRCFWFVTSQDQWEFKKRQEFVISWVICTSNAHNSEVQSLPEKKYSFTDRLSLSLVLESNPCQQLVSLLRYHFTNDNEKIYDRRDDFQNFQPWILHYTFSECHIKKKLIFEKRSKFFANQTNLFSLIESCCCLWFVTSQGQWEFKKRQEFIISWVICPSNAHNSEVQSLHENKYSFTAHLSLSLVLESNPCQQLVSLLRYHYTNDNEKIYDRRDDFQNFQPWILHYTFSECHIKKKLIFEKLSKFFANQTYMFSLIESSRCFWFVTSQGQWEFKKRQEYIISWVICPSNAHNSEVQSLHENKYSFTAHLSLSLVLESNPCQQLVSLLRYHYTNDNEKLFDRRDEFQNFQPWILHDTFSECHIKKTKTNLWEAE